MEYTKVHKTTTKQEELKASIDSINKLSKNLDSKGQELIKENFLFCMLCRNRVMGLTRLVPDFAAEYLTMNAYTEFLSTFESCGIVGDPVKAAVGEFISILSGRD